jgi:hypothetical protein
MWTETIHRADPRASSREMKEAISKEVHGLISRDTFKIVPRSAVDGVNVVPSRFVLAIKHEDSSDKYKARLCLGGHKDVLKSKMVHTATTLSQTSTRLILALAAIFEFDIWTTDVDQAYLQSAATLQKDIYLTTDAIELGAEELLQLVLPLYGLSESGDYWGQTLTDHHLTTLRFEQSAVDSSLYFKREGQELVGLSGTYVDDLLRAARPDIRDYMEQAIRKSFECKPSKRIEVGQTPMTFIGLNLTRTLGGLHASMQTYIERLAVLEENASFDHYRRLRAQLLWVCNARPDICAFVSMCSSVTSQTFSGKDVRAINDRVRYLRRTNAEVRLHFPRLDMQTLHMVVYTDASFGTREDKSSQGGYVVLLADRSKRCCFLGFHSSKIKRIVRSSMAAETLAFGAAFDAAFTLRQELSRLVGRHIPLVMLTDSAGLFDAITRDRRTTEARLMLDLYAARQAYKNKELENVALIRSEHNAADALTKVPGNDALLRVLKSHKVDHPVVQYVITPEANISGSRDK